MQLKLCILLAMGHVSLAVQLLLFNLSSKLHLKIAVTVLLFVIYLLGTPAVRAQSFPINTNAWFKPPYLIHLRPREFTVELCVGHIHCLTNKHWLRRGMQQFDAVLITTGIAANPISWRQVDNYIMCWPGWVPQESTLPPIPNLRLKTRPRIRAVGVTLKCEFY